MPFHRPKFEATDLETEHTTLEGEYLRQIVEIVVRLIPTICSCVSTDYCGKDPQTDLLCEVRHEMDLDEVEVGITLLRHAGFRINTVFPQVVLAPLLRGRQTACLELLLCLTLLNEFGSQHARFCTRPFADSSTQKASFMP